MSTEVTLTGRLGGDPEYRITQSGKGVANLSVVTDRRYKTEAGDWESRDTTWWRVSAWGQLGENVAERLKKGDPVIVVGRAHLNEYEKPDGTKRQSLDVQAFHIGKDERYASGVERGKRTAEDAWSPEPPPF